MRKIDLAHVERLIYNEDDGQYIADVYETKKEYRAIVEQLQSEPGKKAFASGRDQFTAIYNGIKKLKQST
ncbi:hypothetical protein [Numidum massiliense]|uniref:hypothetical protein n=1 Tax=Numidum massiliense TaxID=1522315 RepID=UPI0006D52C6C|nr:hypothetical protein [Numidum massiliense]